jgi:hypothetical protein
MWTDEGWRGFMRGNGTNCIRIIPYSAVQFGAYNIYKRVTQNLRLDLWPYRLTDHSSPNHRLVQTFLLFEDCYVEV